MRAVLDQRPAARPTATIRKAAGCRACVRRPGVLAGALRRARPAGSAQETPPRASTRRPRTRAARRPPPPVSSAFGRQASPSHPHSSARGLYTRPETRRPRLPIRAPMPKVPAQKTPPRSGTPRIGFVSLGCPKALVDSERIITKRRAEGYELCSSYEGADAVVVNTCGFLNRAKEESLAAIGEALVENGKVIVTVCLGVESDHILAAHPGVLAITGPQQYEAVVEHVHNAVPRPHDPFLDLLP